MCAVAAGFDTRERDAVAFPSPRSPAAAEPAVAVTPLARPGDAPRCPTRRRRPRARCRSGRVDPAGGGPR